MIALYSIKSNVTDIYDMKYDEGKRGYIMKHFKTFHCKLKFVIGRDDKLVCDQYVFIK